jgi:dimethylaniline monooxygenase (N-oxide forming)
MRHFKFEKRVYLRCKVVGVVPVPNDEGCGHIVHYVDSRTNPDGEAKETRVDYVSVCSGLHVTPAWPKIPGIDYVVNPKLPNGEKVTMPHEVYHSSEYKGRAQLAGRRVLILGTGETGHDIAYEAVKAGAIEVILCTRGVLLFPLPLKETFDLT